MASSNLAGKSVIVTGGSSGIGLAIVKFFASHNAKIGILDIAGDSLDSLTPSLRAEFPSTTFLFKKCDVSNWEEQKATFGEVYGEFGHVDIVIANAGVSERGNFLQKDEGEPMKPNMATLDINLTGNLYSVKLAVHYMRKNRSAWKGCVVCTASDAGLYPFPIAPMYATSKHGVVGMVRSLARSLELEGIQINGLAPNVVATSIADSHLFAAMILTPVSSVVNAVEEFVTKPNLTGMVAEISGTKFTFRSPPAYVDKDTETNMEAFWKLGYA